MCKLLILGLTLFSSAVLASQSERRILLVNSCSLSKAVVESVKSGAERTMRVPICVTNITAKHTQGLKSIAMEASAYKGADDVCAIVLASPDKAESSHVVALTNSQVVVINVRALSTNDAVCLERRLEKSVIRSVAITLGISSDPDPYCVMHDYKTVEDLDKLGLNFSPPWSEAFSRAAITHGMVISPIIRKLPRVKKPETVPAK